jgi:triosephosphate isomerase
MARPLIYAANWKMNLGPASAREFMHRFLELTTPAVDRSLWFFPPAVSIAAATEAAAGRRDVVVGAQNVHWEPKGAFTGELSLPLVREAGARAVLVGHSERRHLFGETDDQIGRKVTAALKAGVDPLICVGETLAEREGGRTEQVIQRQVHAILERVPLPQWDRIRLAYEPVWAIGTGRTPTPQDVQEVHGFIRDQLNQRFSGEGARIRILYGGSVKPSNAAELLAVPNVNGALIGGASLKATDFLGIAQAVA